MKNDTASIAYNPTMPPHKAITPQSTTLSSAYDYVYEHFTAFKLIFCRSAGTSYEHFFDKLAGIEEEYYKEFAKKYAAPGVHISDFFIHVMCRTGWQYIYEIVSHDLPHEEAVDFMKNIRRYFYAGWQNVLGIEVLKKEPEKKNYKD